MRRLEILLLVIVGLAALLPVIVGFRLKRGRAAIVLVAAVVAQLFVEGYRWQLLPLQIAAVGLAVDDLIWEDRRVRGWPRWRRCGLGVVGLVLVGLLPLALPIPSLPRPTGPYAVGTKVYELIDWDRPEAYGVAESPVDGEAGEQVEELPRRLMVQVWYPSDSPPGTEPMLWNPDWDVVGPALSRRLGFPSFMLSHVGEVRSHSFSNAPFLSGRFPVVIYSHGWTGFRTIALNQMESLASHGYVVIAVDHTYGSIAVRFPDGEVVDFDPSALPDKEGFDGDDYQEASVLLVQTFAEDLDFVLDTLEAGPGGSLGVVAAHADLDRIGLYGHSTGGGAAARICLTDPRCKALVGFDAWVEPLPDRILASELGVPSLFARSDEWRGVKNDGRLRGIAERSSTVSYWLGIQGASHNDFVLTPAFSPIASNLGLKGPIPGDRVIEILDRYLVSFFDRYLFELGAFSLDAPPPPEVDLEIITG